MTVETAQRLIARTQRRRLLAAALSALGTLAAVYVLLGGSRNHGEPLCRPALDIAHRIAPLAHGEVAAVSVAEDAQKIPSLAFQDSAGAVRSLADWHGRTVLFNLWATWCVPCRREMPALDALQEKLGGPDFEVVAVNIDTRDPDKPKNWLHDVGIGHLAYYSDAKARVFQDLKGIGKAVGMPTTLLLDPNGCEIASLAGPAEWSSDDAVTLVNAAMGR